MYQNPFISYPTLTMPSLDFAAFLQKYISGMLAKAMWLRR